MVGDSQHVARRSHTQPSSGLLQKASFHCPEPSIITQSSPRPVSPPLLGSPGRQLLEQKSWGQRMEQGEGAPLLSA